MASGNSFTVKTAKYRSNYKKKDARRIYLANISKHMMKFVT